VTEQEFYSRMDAHMVRIDAKLEDLRPGADADG
jgi:hypothetical protein